MRTTKIRVSKKRRTIMTTKQGKLNANAEAMMMGLVVPVNSNEDAVYMTDYIMKTLNKGDDLTGQEVLDKHINRYWNNTVKHMVVNTIMEDMITIAYTLDDGDEPYPEDLTTRYGVFSYVLNLTVPHFSELGYTFYEKRDGFMRRVG